VLGVALTLFLTFLNYRGIRLSANFQKGMTSVVLLIFISLVAISTARGTPAKLHPVFHGAPLVSILLTLQIVPYFLTGFESVPKYAEEANPDLRGRTYMTAIAMALGVGVSFYALSLFAVSYIAPWQSLLGKRFATAIAFEHGLGAHWIVQLIFTMAMFGLFQCFNGNFVASTRMLFAFSRNGSIPEGLSRVHPRFQTPTNAVLLVGAGTLVALFLGDSLLVPVTEVGSAASAFGWLAACVSMVLVLRKYVLPATRLRVVAIFGSVAAFALVAMKFLPFVPGHFTEAEYIALAIWLFLGLLLWRRKRIAAT
jgi:APA family basic amino acid/polyamine antiporter